MGYGPLNALFDDKYVIMIDYDLVRRQFDSPEDLDTNSISEAPAILALDKNGVPLGPAVVGIGTMLEGRYAEYEVIERYFETVSVGN